MTTPVLFFAPGTCARVPLIALEEIGEPFEATLVAFAAGDHRTPDFLAVNPAGKVPVLATADGPIAQNTAILWYLATKYPESGLLPLTGNHFEDSGLMSQLVRFSSDLHPLVTRIVLPVLFAEEPVAQAQVRNTGMESMAFQLQSLEKALDKMPWLLGDRWSILDAYLGWVWFRIVGAGFDEAAFPSIGDHYSRLRERPAVQRALAREAQAQEELESNGLAVPGVKNR